VNLAQAAATDAVVTGSRRRGDRASAPDPAPEPEDGPAAGAEAPDAEEELPPLPPDVAPAGPSPQRFNPTEKVRADFPVSFPIDI
jgi:hypothetical protein